MVCKNMECMRWGGEGRRERGEVEVTLLYTVEPQSYGLHNYGKLGQPDTEIEYIFGKYHQNFY